MKYVVPEGTNVCRYGPDEGPTWLESTKEAVYTDVDRVRTREGVYEIISQWKPSTIKNNISVESYWWFKTPDKKYPFFAVGKYYVKVIEEE